MLRTPYYLLSVDLLDQLSNHDIGVYPRMYFKNLTHHAGSSHSIGPIGLSGQLVYFGRHGDGLGSRICTYIALERNGKDVVDCATYLTIAGFAYLFHCHGTRMSCLRQLASHTATASLERKYICTYIYRRLMCSILGSSSVGCWIHS